MTAWAEDTDAPAGPGKSGGSKSSRERLAIFKEMNMGKITLLKMPSLAYPACTIRGKLSGIGLILATGFLKKEEGVLLM